MPSRRNDFPEARVAIDNLAKPGVDQKLRGTTATAFILAAQAAEVGLLDLDRLWEIHLQSEAVITSPDANAAEINASFQAALDRIIALGVVIQEP